MLYEVLLVFLQILPILHVLGQIYFIDGPEAGHLVLVHLPDVVVLDWKQDEAVWVVLEQGLRLHFLILLAIGAAHLRSSSYTLRWNNLAACTAIPHVVLIEQLRAACSL